MLFALELFTAVLGIKLLYVEAVQNRFYNYTISIFLTCFVPLFCVYPVIARLVVGGAYSVGRANEGVIPDSAVYVIYQVFCLGTLFVIAMSRPKVIADHHLADWQDKYETTASELIQLVTLVTMGVFLFIYATGASIGDLISGSRFEWMTYESYSSGLFVVSTYFLALSPVAIMLALNHQRYRWIATIFLIAVLVLYGLITKDRRSLIYSASAIFAYVYIRNSFSIRLTKTAVIPVLLIVAALVFWQVVRGVLFNYYLTGSGDVAYESQQVAINLLTKGDLPYYYNASATAIDVNLNYDFSIPFGIVSRQLLFFLPANYSFGLKVEDISALFSDVVGGEDGSRRGNMPPGYFGLFAISFGWFGGIAACSLVPLALRWLDRVIHRNRGSASIVLVAHMLSSMLLLLRGDDSSATYFIISSLVFLYLIRPATLFGRRVPRAY